MCLTALSTTIIKPPDGISFKRILFISPVYFQRIKVESIPMYTQFWPDASLKRFIDFFEHTFRFVNQ